MTDADRKRLNCFFDAMGWKEEQKAWERVKAEYRRMKAMIPRSGLTVGPCFYCGELILASPEGVGLCVTCKAAAAGGVK